MYGNYPILSKPYATQFYRTHPPSSHLDACKWLILRRNVGSQLTHTHTRLILGSVWLLEMVSYILALFLPSFPPLCLFPDFFHLLVFSLLPFCPFSYFCVPLTILVALSHTYPHVLATSYPFLIPILVPTLSYVPSAFVQYYHILLGIQLPYPGLRPIFLYSSSLASILLSISVILSLVSSVPVFLRLF